MKKITHVMIYTLAALLVSTAAADNFYGPHGNNVGRAETDSNGNTRYYDRNGAYQGRRDSSGHYYDRNGAYQGRHDSGGRFYDKNGAYRGRKQ